MTKSSARAMKDEEVGVAGVGDACEEEEASLTHLDINQKDCQCLRERQNGLSNPIEDSATKVGRRGVAIVGRKLPL